MASQCFSSHIEDSVPDAKTYWTFRTALANAHAIRGLFDAFTKQLEDARIITHADTIIGAIFVDAPRQRNTRKENACIKDGDTHEEWKSEENANELRQKDTDARWAKKVTVSLHGLTVRSIGIARARVNAGLTNLVYNLCRYEIWMRTA